MAQAVTHKYCSSCVDNVKAQKNPIRHGVHLVLSVLTVGCWLAVYLLIVIPWHMFGKHYKCTICGKNVSSFTKSPEKIAVLKAKRNNRIEQKIAKMSK